MQAGEGDGRETWTCSNEECGKCAGIYEMLMLGHLEPDSLASWIRDHPAYFHRAFLMGREMSCAQDAHYIDCLQALLSAALQEVQQHSHVPDFGYVLYFMAGILDGDGHRIVRSWQPE